MKNKENELDKPHARPSVSSTCLRCGHDVSDVSITENAITVEPCGHDAQFQSATELIADGGVRWTDLTGFQRDLVKGIIELDRDQEAISGSHIKEKVGSVRGEDVNHGRLYPNLDEFVEYDLIDKGEWDQRTNDYSPTDDAIHMYRSEIAGAVEILEVSL